MTNILGRFFVIAVLIGGTSIIGAAEDYPGLTGHRFQVRTALDTYRAVDDSNQFKLFAVGTQGAYAWWNGQSYEELYKWVMNSCGGLSNQGRCKLYAVGNTIVWEMSEAERDQVIAGYSSNQPDASENPYPLVQVVGKGQSLLRAG